MGPLLARLGRVHRIDVGLLVGEGGRSNIGIIATANTTFTGLLALAPCQELKQTGCSYRVGFIQSEFGLEVRCPGKKGIEVIFNYFGQRFIKLFCPLANFPKAERITIHLKARLVRICRIPIVDSKAVHSPDKCIPLVHIPGPKFLEPNSQPLISPDDTKKTAPLCVPTDTIDPLQTSDVQSDPLPGCRTASIQPSCTRPSSPMS